jgi:hypothetical protein
MLNYCADRVAPEKTDISTVLLHNTILRNTMRGIKMKKIDISTPKYPNTFTIVDDEDYDKTVKLHWYATRCAKSIYAQSTSLWKTYKHLTMHRFIMNAQKGQEVDHVNHNTLDNRRCNLRLCSHIQNMQNMKPYEKAASEYKGVTWDKERKKWRAKLCIGRKQVFSFRYNSEIDAAKAFDRKAKELYGEFAYQNFPE